MVIEISLVSITFWELAKAIKYVITKRKIVFINPLIFYDLILLDIKHRSGNDIPQTIAIIKSIKLSLYKVLNFIAPKLFPVAYAMGPATIPKTVWVKYFSIIFLNAWFNVAVNPTHIPVIQRGAMKLIELYMPSYDNILKFKSKLSTKVPSIPAINNRLISAFLRFFDMLKIWMVR